MPDELGTDVAQEDAIPTDVSALYEDNNHDQATNTKRRQSNNDAESDDSTTSSVPEN